MSHECYIEIGESTGAKKLDLKRWWWIIHAPGCTINSANAWYRSKRAAMRRARTLAARFGLTVKRVFVCGVEEGA